MVVFTATASTTLTSTLVNTTSS